MIGGQNSVDDKGQLVPGDLGAQTTQALHNLKLCLEAAGAGIDNLVKVTIYIAGDLDIMPGFQSWVKFAGQPTNPPIVTVIKVLALGRPGVLVEIEATAVLPG
jgi:enamine deaminase RidA (YjgF/YER057c/UK114 family)